MITAAEAGRAWLARPEAARRLRAQRAEVQALRARLLAVAAESSDEALSDDVVAVLVLAGRLDRRLLPSEGGRHGKA